MKLVVNQDLRLPVWIQVMLYEILKKYFPIEVKWDDSVDLSALFKAMDLVYSLMGFKLFLLKEVKLHFYSVEYVLQYSACLMAF